jgi:hypothetical protein
VGARNRKPESLQGENQGLLEYREARAIAADIAQQDNKNSDVVFSDAMHVAVALALEGAGMPYTGPNTAWMFEQISPAEVREVLVFRRDHREDYGSLPKATIIESLNATQIKAANGLAMNLTRAELDAFFFGKASGTA